MREREDRVISRLECALLDALRWKTALDAANKGARRKSKQARYWRTNVDTLKDELKWLRRAKESLEDENIRLKNLIDTTEYKKVEVA